MCIAPTPKKLRHIVCENVCECVRMCVCMSWAEVKLPEHPSQSQVEAPSRSRRWSFFLVKSSPCAFFRTFFLGFLLSFLFDNGPHLGFVQEDTLPQFFGRLAITDSTKVENLQHKLAQVAQKY